MLIFPVSCRYDALQLEPSEFTNQGFTYKERLDHILYSDHFDSCSAEVIKVKSSDHYPVFVVLEKK